MSRLARIREAFRHARLVWRQDPCGDRWGTLAALARLEWGWIRHGEARRTGARESILGLEVEFFDYRFLVALFREIFLHRQYDFLPPGERPLVLDCGSNIGLAILELKRRVPGARVFGFEPNPETFAVLRRNVEANRLEDVELHQVGLGGEEGEFELHLDPEHGGSPMATLKPGRLGGGSVTVPVRRLSDFVTEEVDLLKLDIEGMEEDVLHELRDAGALPRIRRMVLEYNHHHLGAREDRLGKVLGLLEEEGFGYLLHAPLHRPLRPGKDQDMLIYAYRSSEA